MVMMTEHHDDDDEEEEEEDHDHGVDDNECKIRGVMEQVDDDGYVDDDDESILPTRAEI
jgi:hypothetical protein